MGVPRTKGGKGGSFLPRRQRTRKTAGLQVKRQVQKLGRKKLQQCQQHEQHLRKIR